MVRADQPEFRIGLRIVLGDQIGEADRLDRQAGVALPFVTAAYLLASSARPSEWWFDYLDRVETALEQ